MLSARTLSSPSPELEVDRSDRQSFGFELFYAAFGCSWTSKESKGELQNLEQTSTPPCKEKAHFTWSMLHPNFVSVSLPDSVLFFFFVVGDPVILLDLN